MGIAFKRIFLALSAPILLCGLLPTQTPKRTATHSKKAPAKTSPAAHGRAASSREAASGGTARVHDRKVIVTRKKVHGKWVRTTQVVSAPRRPSYQQHPDPERYQQIQQALADRGYYKGEVNGQWGDDSVAALKRFQSDKQIPNDGKVTSLSLAGLGLGPGHGASAPSTPAPAPVPAAEKPPNSN